MSLWHSNKIFLDLLSGYRQVPVPPESRKIIAFSTPNEHHEWLNIPSGLKSMLITFQRMINTLFSDIPGTVSCEATRPLAYAPND